MKKLFVAIAAVLVSASAFAQLAPGVQFNNRITGIVDAPITRPDGTGAGAGVTAELVMISGGNTTVLTPSTTFRTTSAAAAFYLTSVDVPIPGGTAGQQVQLAVRAYETAAGSYANASGGTTHLFGQSAPITVTLNDPALPGATLAGLQGFQLQVVPEPSTIALGILGAAALLLRRRK
jgi:hypothetical protein